MAAPVVELTPALRPWPETLRALWHRREIIGYLAWRDIRARYHQTVLGATWAIVQPLAATVIFALVFERLIKVSSKDTPYPVFVLSGLLPWQFVATSIQRSSLSLLANSAMIKKVYFPRLAMPIAAVVTTLVEFAAACVVLLGLMLYYRVAPTAWLLLLPAMMLLGAGVSLGIGLLLAGVNCRFRDATHAVAFLLQMWMLLTPIVYPLSLVPEPYQLYLRCNPMTGVIGGFRTALLGQEPDGTALAASAAFAALFLVVGGAVFRRAERVAADLL